MVYRQSRGTNHPLLYSYEFRLLKLSKPLRGSLLRESFKYHQNRVLIMFRKKGQTALEFLMTYGWAIIVVLAAIAALAYFGILSPDRFLPDKCTMSPGVFCAQYKIDGTNNKFQLQIENKFGVGITDVNINLTGRSPLSCTYVQNVTQPLENDEGTAILDFPCPGLSALTKAKVDVVVNFRRVTETIPHQIRGTILGVVER